MLDWSWSDHSCVYTLGKCVQYSCLVSKLMLTLQPGVTKNETVLTLSSNATLIESVIAYLGEWIFRKHFSTLSITSCTASLVSSLILCCSALSNIKWQRVHSAKRLHQSAHCNYFPFVVAHLDRESLVCPFPVFIFLSVRGNWEVITELS